jgi:hypothetical protein
MTPTDHLPELGQAHRRGIPPTPRMTLKYPGQSRTIILTHFASSYSLDKYTNVRVRATEQDPGIKEVIHNVPAAHTSRLTRQSGWNDIM